MPFEAAQSFGFGMSLRLLVQVVRAAERMRADLAQRHDVERGVQLTVTESGADHVATRGFQWRHPAVGGEVAGGREPMDVADATQQDRREHRPDAVQLQE